MFLVKGFCLFGLLSLLNLTLSLTLSLILHRVEHQGDGLCHDAVVVGLGLALSSGWLALPGGAVLVPSLPTTWVCMGSDMMSAG